MQNTHAQCGCRACERAREWARVHAEQAMPDLAVALARAERLFKVEVDVARARLAEVERERDDARAGAEEAFRVQLAGTARERDEVRARLAEVERERDAARADLYETREDLRPLRTQVPELRDQLAGTARERDEARARLADVEAARDALDLRLTGEILDLHEKLHNLQGRLAGAGEAIRQDRAALARARRLFDVELDAVRARLAAVERERDQALAVRANQEATICDLGKALASAIDQRDCTEVAAFRELLAKVERERDRHLATLETIARERMLCVVCLKATGTQRQATIWASAGGPGFPVCAQCWGNTNPEAPRGRPARVGDVIVNRRSGAAERIVRLDMGPLDAIDAYTMAPDFEGDPLAGTPEEVEERLGPPIRGARWWDAWQHADGAPISAVDLHAAPTSG